MSDLSDPGDLSDWAASAKPETESSPGYGLISSTSAPARPQVSAAWAESTNEAEANAPQIVEEPEHPVAAVELSDTEARVLGSLIEKSFLTPDAYPMTTNGMVTACNQKTNRDPVVDYSAVVIDASLMEMRQRNLVRRVHSPGSRSTKHRQTLDEALSLSERQLVLVSVLLLRGPQTIGELRLRTERHDVGFDDLDAVESCLVGLASRMTPLVVQLERQPGHKEARWQHLLGDGSTPVADDNIATSRSDTGSGSAAVAPAAAPTPNPTALEARVRELETAVATLRRQLAGLAEQLGESLG